MSVKKIYAIAFWAVAFMVLVPATRAEVALLRGGASVSGNILKRDSKAVVFDLGYDALRIPMTQVLEIHKESLPLDSVLSDTAGRLYEEKTMKVNPTTDSIETYSPSVLLVRTPKGLGSGFFINQDGYVITNFHVIKGERHITVSRLVQSGKESRRVVYRDVRVVAVDPFHDLAVLRVEDPIKNPISPVVFDPGDKPTLGETVFVIGNPLGLERTVTEGVVSHTSRNFGGNLYLQIDAPVNPGNSGGPLFNSRGQVIGVINMGVLTMEGLNFAIPIRNVKFLLDNLDAFAFDEGNPESGYFYPEAPRRPGKALSELKPESVSKF